MVLRLPFAEAFNNAYRLSVCVRACVRSARVAVDSGGDDAVKLAVWSQ
jgi:hypothetical protein